MTFLQICKVVAQHLSEINDYDKLTNSLSKYDGINKTEIGNVISHLLKIKIAEIYYYFEDRPLPKTGYRLNPKARIAMEKGEEIDYEHGFTVNNDKLNYETKSEKVENQYNFHGPVTNTGPTSFGNYNTNNQHITTYEQRNTCINNLVNAIKDSKVIFQNEKNEILPELQALSKQPFGTQIHPNTLAKIQKTLAVITQRLTPENGLMLISIMADLTGLYGFCHQYL